MDTIDIAQLGYVQNYNEIKRIKKDMFNKENTYLVMLTNIFLIGVIGIGIMFEDFSHYK